MKNILPLVWIHEKKKIHSFTLFIHDYEKNYFLNLAMGISSGLSLANQPILLIDFLVGATTPESPDQNGNHWNTVGQQGDVNANGTNLRLTNGTVVNGLNVNLVEFGTPTSNGQWTGASPSRQGQPSWVAADSLSALDDRANLGRNLTGTMTIEGLPELQPGQWFRIELVSAAIGDFGTSAPGLWNLEAGNSVGGNQAGNNVDSIVPTNGLTGDPFVWTENSGTTNDNRFGFALFPNTSGDDSIAPSQGWLVWDNVLPENNSFTIHASTHGPSNGNQRAPINAISVTVIPEPSTYAAIFGLFAIGLIAWRRRKS